MFDLRSHTHLLVVAGSRAYGMATAESDVDVKGFAVAPLGDRLGVAAPFEHADRPEQIATFLADLTAEECRVATRTKLEGSVYALQKLARLALACNPHVLDVLFCRDAEIRVCTPIGARLRERARDFLSMRARHAFAGYASAQLKRIRSHRRWLLEPPAGAPTREAFGLPDPPVVPRSQLEAARAAIRKQIDSWELDLSQVDPGTAIGIQNRLAEVIEQIGDGADPRWSAAARRVGLGDDLIAVLAAERRYHRAATEWRQYRGWKRNRNPERAALEAAHGYDTKHGAHLVRLLTMAREVVETGEVRIWRGDRDADTLLAIRAGAWTYDALLAWAKATGEAIDAALPDSPLPAHPDRDAVNDLVIELALEAVRGA